MAPAEPTNAQRLLLDALLNSQPNASVEWDAARGVVRHLRDLPLAPANRTVEDFLGEFGALFGPEHLVSAVVPFRDRGDELGWRRVEFVQQLTPSAAWLPAWLEGRLEVYGGRLAVHVNDGQEIVEVQSSCWRDAELADAPQLGERELRDVLTRLARRAPGFGELSRQMADAKEERFPLMEAPRLVAYPWKGAFVPSWVVYAYGPTDPEENDAGGELVLGLTVVDALDGDRLLFAPTRMNAENPTTGTGTAVTPLGSPATRTLDIVRVDATSTYRLRDTTHAREVLTYDAAGSSTMATTPQIVSGIVSGTLQLSADVDGDRAWTATPTDSSDAQRTAGQQPEVDAHYFCADLYEFFDALAGGRAGWDNGNFPNPPVPPQAVRVLAHVYDSATSTTRAVNAFYDKGLQGGRWYAFVAMFDGNPTATCSTANDRAFGYLAGSAFVVAHEYQHAMTDFAMEDTNGNPGLMNLDWFNAVHEGLSDVFGGLYSEVWKPGPEFSPAGLVFRNIAYPPDPQSVVNRSGSWPCGGGGANKDHWVDRNLDGGRRYDRGTIIAHCAYLMGAGGVHQRTSRMPVVIPVRSIGRQTVGGRDVLRAARVWFRAVHTYFSTHGNLTGIPVSDENVFRTLRNGCVSAASDIFGAGSLEHRTTILAFYACGLQPIGTPYGPDVTFLTWGADWTGSAPHVALSSPTWASLDLFVNNGGGLSEWNAQVNVMDAMGNPTQFENTVYCRVRNVGDQAATNVQVSLSYAKVGTAPAVWQPMTDASGAAQTISIGTLQPGQSSFPQFLQASPPAAASVKWWIPPLAAGETVDHYCIRADVTSANDVNPHNNSVQSNIVYTAYDPAAGFRFSFTAGNPAQLPMVLKLAVTHTLPKGWTVRLLGRTRRKLKPGEELPLEVEIDMREGSDAEIAPPFDGDVAGELTGMVTGSLRGTFTGATGAPDALEGRVTGEVQYLGSVTGWFVGGLDVTTGLLDGRLDAVVTCLSGDRHTACTRLVARLRPWRRIDITQLDGNVQLGGLTIQVQVPGPGVEELPPTGTRVKV